MDVPALLDIYKRLTLMVQKQEETFPHVHVETDDELVREPRNFEYDEASQYIPTGNLEQPIFQCHMAIISYSGRTAGHPIDCAVLFIEYKAQQRLTFICEYAEGDINRKCTVTCDTNTIPQNMTPLYTQIKSTNTRQRILEIRSVENLMELQYIEFDRVGARLSWRRWLTDRMIQSTPPTIDANPIEIINSQCPNIDDIHTLFITSVEDYIEDRVVPPPQGPRDP
jgi:hypothetical protein